MGRTKSWAEKIAGAPAPHVEVLEKPFGGLPVGGRLLISSPARIRAHVETLPRGTTADPVAMRALLAAEAGADGTCPLTTGIFLRIVAEAALERITAGAAPAEVTPFWRIVDPKSPLAKKLSCGPDFIREMRALEASG